MGVLKRKGPIGLGEVKLKRRTPRAILVDSEYGDIWVPSSVIHENSEVWGSPDSNVSGVLVVEHWWAEKEGHA